MDAEFWDPNDFDMEFIGNLNPESDDDNVSAMIFEQLGMVDHRQGKGSKKYKTEGMPDDRTIGLLT